MSEEDGLTVEVDDGVCMAAGECVRVAPDVFVIDEEEMVATTTDAVAGASPDLLRRAAQACPVRAISVRPSP